MVQLSEERALNWREAKKTSDIVEADKLMEKSVLAGDKLQPVYQQLLRRVGYALMCLAVSGIHTGMFQCVTMLLMRGAGSGSGGIRKLFGKASSKKGFKTPAPTLVYYSDDRLLLLLYRQVTAALANTSVPGASIDIYITIKGFSHKRVLIPEEIGVQDPAARPLCWVQQWVDYSDQYGFAYRLRDKSMGVLFNDDISLILDADERWVSSL